MTSDSSLPSQSHLRGRLPKLGRYLFLITMGVCAIIYFPSAYWGLGLDQNIFAEIASLLRSGHKLYVDAWDVKPPNIYYTYALFEWLEGETARSIRMADMLAGIVSWIVVYIAVVRSALLAQL